jgi:hypothetical protein
VVEYNGSEKPIMMWAKCFKNLAMWNAIAHNQPLQPEMREEPIKHSFSLVDAQVFLTKYIQIRMYLSSIKMA